uniref:Solute carrier family 66 member 3 n=1 Tax=Equus caballus TaxID=9796 RepID=A0A9L0T391_HORSE
GEGGRTRRAGRPRVDGCSWSCDPTLRAPRPRPVRRRHVGGAAGRLQLEHPGRVRRAEAAADLRRAGGAQRAGHQPAEPAAGAGRASSTISRVLQTILCSWVRRGLRAVSAESSSSSALRGALPLRRFLVFLRYQCYYEYPLLTYLEYPILILQGNRPSLPAGGPAALLPLTGSLSLSDLILLLCIFHFNGDVRRAAPYIALLVTSWFLLTLQKWIIDVAINLCTFISAASKFAQLQDLWKTKDSGVMSALTCSLASYTCATRIITTLMTTNDLTILTRFVIMMTLNIWVTATVLRYQKTDVKAE